MQDSPLMMIWIIIRHSPGTYIALGMSTEVSSVSYTCKKGAICREL